MSRREGSHSAVADRYGLTDRQRQVLALMAEGRTNYDIAQELGLSLEGAKYHVSEILGKLGVDSREEAVAIARHREWPWPNLRRFRIWAPLATVFGAATVVLAAFLFSGDGGAPTGPPHVWVAFIHSSASGASRLEVVDGTADTHRVIGDKNLNYAGAIWSPDGSRLLSFAIDPANPSAAASARLFDADNGWHERSLGLAASLGSPQWSPDGKYLAFVSIQETRLVDRDGGLVADIPGGNVARGGTVFGARWAPDSSKFAAVVNNQCVVVGIDGSSSLVSTPNSVEPILQLDGWKDSHTLVVISSTGQTDETNPPNAYTVDLDVSPFSWTPAAIGDGIPKNVQDLFPTANAISSAAVNEKLTYLGPSADGRGMVFFRRSQPGSEVAVAVSVQFNGADTRIPMPADVSSIQPDRNAIVIAPGR